jgi:cardiolipin synthase
MDERWGLLGSANMDTRSFRLNFELTAVLYDAGAVQHLAQYVEGFRQAARRITPRAAHQRPWPQQLGEGCARLLAPLL